MKNINLMSLDMEYNQPSNTIIQVGIAIGNLATGDILIKECHNIKVDEEISEYITNLTGIKQSNVDGEFSSNLLDVYEHLKSLHTYYNCFRNALTWGGGDSQDLRNALDLDDESFLFGRRWIDAKTLFISHCFKNDLKHQSGLAKSMTRLGLQFEGRKHNAMDDAANTFRIYRRLLEDEDE